MYISRINPTYTARQLNRTQAKKNQNIMHDPSFKRARYLSTFAKYFNDLEKNVSNEQKFRELMSSARNAQGSIIDDVAQVFFKPEDYNKIMEGFRKGRLVYDSLNSCTYLKPVWLVKNGDDPLVSVVNFGYQGGLFGALTFNLSHDTRICFHGIDKYEKCIICLGKDNNGNDTQVKTSDGINILIAGLM